MADMRVLRFPGPRNVQALRWEAASDLDPDELRDALGFHAKSLVRSPKTQMTSHLTHRIMDMIWAMKPEIMSR